MADHVKLRFFNFNTKEYLKSIVPVVWTKDPNVAYCVESDTDKIDYPWVSTNVIHTLECIYSDVGLKTNIVMWFYDGSDRDFAHLTLNYDPTPGKAGIFASLVRDPTYTMSAELEDAVSTICDNLMNELGDIIIRVSTSTKPISSTISAATSGTAGPTPTSSSAEVDKILQHISNNTQAEVVKPKETLADYVCNSVLKEELEEIKDFFEHNADYTSKGIVIPKGVLFKGPWGTGKTYAARCIAGSVDCYFMQCTASALQGMYIGSGAQNIRDIFKAARLLIEKSGKGVIIFIDELDSFGNRATRSGGAGGEEDRTINQLLAEMSGFEDSDNIMVLAATNFPERLDAALMRAGRFGRQITIEKPDDYERLAMVEYYFKKISIPLESGLDYNTINDLCKNLTPAEIKEIANEASILTVRQKLSTINIDNVNEAINKVITKNIRHPDKPTDKPNLVAAHESGHVLAEVLYANTIPLKVTNYSYGDAGGFTQPSADLLNNLPSKENFIADVKMLLGGRAAEEVICNTITSGASNDLERVKNILKAYYERFHFEEYDVSKLDQIVLDKLHEIYKEVVSDFKKPANLKYLQDLTDTLALKRVLYQADLSGIVGALLKVRI